MATHTRLAIEEYIGARATLRPSFELAEDSAVELDSYLHLGRVLVARIDGNVVAHLQIVDADAGEAELKSLAVRTDLQGRGIGTRLVEAARALLVGEGVRRFTVSTAAASAENLRFYQRRGFRMCAIERDAFSSANGYPDGIVIDGIPMRDRVWLDMEITGRSAAAPTHAPG